MAGSSGYNPTARPNLQPLLSMPPQGPPPPDPMAMGWGDANNKGKAPPPRIPAREAVAEYERQVELIRPGTIQQVKAPPPALLARRAQASQAKASLNGSRASDPLAADEGRPHTEQLEAAPKSAAAGNTGGRFRRPWLRNQELENEGEDSAEEEQLKDWAKIMEMANNHDTDPFGDLGSSTAVPVPEDPATSSTSMWRTTRSLQLGQPGVPPPKAPELPASSLPSRSASVTSARSVEPLAAVTGGLNPHAAEFIPSSAMQRGSSSSTVAPGMNIGNSTSYASRAAPGLGEFGPPSQLLGTRPEDSYGFPAHSDPILGGAPFGGRAVVSKAPGFKTPSMASPPTPNVAFRGFGTAGVPMPMDGADSGRSASPPAPQGGGSSSSSAANYAANQLEGSPQQSSHGRSILRELFSGVDPSQGSTRPGPSAFQQPYYQGMLRDPGGEDDDNGRQLEEQHRAYAEAMVQKLKLVDDIAADWHWCEDRLREFKSDRGR